MNELKELIEALHIHEQKFTVEEVEEIIKDYDFVPVVRCKDCIHYSKGLFQGKGCCRRKNYTFGGKGTSNLDVYVSYNVEDDHYCSDGESEGELECD